MRQFDSAVGPYLLRGVTEGLGYDAAAGQMGAPAVGNCTTNITVIFSGFSAKNADDAKNTAAFMRKVV